jgi:hypothetical protein
VVIGRRPRWDSIQYAAIGSALDSTGVPSGYFQGAIDNVRIWKCARTSDQIAENLDSDCVTGDGLAGAWNLNEGTGLTASNFCGSINGTLKNGAAWTSGTLKAKALGFAPAAALALLCPAHPLPQWNSRTDPG